MFILMLLFQIKVEEHSFVADFLYNSCSSSSAEKFHGIVPGWKMWSFRGRWFDNV